VVQFSLFCIVTVDCAPLLCRHGLWVYDFALPLLMLHALKFKTAEPLRHWISICPRRQITTLDTHDGM
jgi:sucrose phosphorylase